MVNKSIRRGIFALAASGMLASSFAFTATPAFAGQGNSCDVSVATLVKVSSEDGKPLAGASFRVDGSPNVYLKEGDKSGDEAAFTSAFSKELGALSDTEAGKAIEEAYVNNLGRTFPGYPPDYTSATGQQRPGAIIKWQNDDEGKLAAYEADLDRRLAALQKVLDKNPGLEAGDLELYTLTSSAVEKLTRSKEALVTAKTTSDWETFVTSYRTAVDVDNWSFGLTKEPSLEYQDMLNNVKEDKWAEANATAAKTIDAKSSITVTTNAEGKAVFTLYGVKAAHADRYTRGDLTCDQLGGKAVEITAPNGYKLDATPHSFVSNDKKVINFTVKNTLATVTPTPTPTVTPSTPATPKPKPTGSVDTGAPTSPVNWGFVGGGAVLVIGAGAAVFLVTRRRKGDESGTRAH